MSRYPRVVGQLALVGDITPADWEAWFEVPYAQVVKPAVAVRDAAWERLGHCPSRCEGLGRYFNEVAPEREDGTRNDKAVKNYYATRLYDSWCAMELPESGALGYLLDKAMGCWEGEPHQALVREATRRFGCGIDVLSHGWGDGAHILGMMTENARARYYTMEVASPLREFLIHHVRLRTRIGLPVAHDHPFPETEVYPGWMYPSGAFSLTGPEERPLLDGTVHAIHSCEVLEHVVAPEKVAAGFAQMLRPGGLLMLSTFFNSMDGHDPQHLRENEKYQDEGLWFGVLEGLGLRPYWRDPRGVLKIWEKVG